MERSMDRTMKDNMVDGLFFCAKLTGHRGGHTTFVQAGAETSDTSAEAVKLNSRCSWQCHSRSVGADDGDESTESRSALQPVRIALMIRPERRTSVFVVWMIVSSAPTRHVKIYFLGERGQNVYRLQAASTRNPTLRLAPRFAFLIDMKVKCADFKQPHYSALHKIMRLCNYIYIFFLAWQLFRNMVKRSLTRT